MKLSAAVLLACAAFAAAGKFHDPSRPCFRRSEHRDEVLAGPRMHDIIDVGAAAKTLDWREELKNMGGSISAARQQHQPQ